MPIENGFAENRRSGSRAVREDLKETQGLAAMEMIFSARRTMGHERIGPAMDNDAEKYGQYLTYVPRAGGGDVTIHSVVSVPLPALGGESHPVPVPADTV